MFESVINAEKYLNKKMIAKFYKAKRFNLLLRKGNFI